MRLARGQIKAQVRTTVVAASILAAAALHPSGAANACSAPSPPKPQQLVEQATTIVHVIVRGTCDELGGPCDPLSLSPSKPSTPEAPVRAKPYAPGWPPIAAPPMMNRGTPKHHGPGADYELLGMEVLEVLKGSLRASTVAIRGKLVTQDDYNDQAPPYTFVRRGGRSGNCFAYTYRRGAEYLLLLRNTNDVLTPYWAPHAPVNEQVSSKNDQWIEWVRQQHAGK
jgi:hypothetical protein